MSEPVLPGTGGLGRAQEIRSADGGGNSVSIYGPWPKSPVVITQGSAYQIGRMPKNDLVLEGPTVSRNHATIVWAPESERPTIEDLASANGTILDGVPVKAGEPRALVEGAVIDIGEHKLGVGKPAPGAKTPVPKTGLTPPPIPRPGLTPQATPRPEATTTAVPPGSTALSASSKISRPTERLPRQAPPDSRHDGIGYVSFSNKKGK